jgi:3-deoxy-D-manno-octulosonate 8-phosphate phosphatase (KDO 8-P phosphatase)
VSESVRLRATELQVDDLVQDPKARKLPAIRRIAEARGIGLDEMAFVGDDLPDVGALRAVGLPVLVGNATDDARRAAPHGVQLLRRGGARRRARVRGAAAACARPVGGDDRALRRRHDERRPDRGGAS